MSKIMKAIASQAWLIEPSHLETIVSIASREHEAEVLATKVGKKMENTRRVELHGDVAVIDVIGPIYRYANLFTEVCGAVSTDMLAKDLRAANDNPRVKTILLNLDCPGGQAAGIWELASYIREIKKPVIGYVDDVAASGGYWIAAACDHIAAARTAMVGSIGAVYSFRIDDGVKKIEVVSSVSPKKRFDVSTEEGKAQVQTWADKLGDIFLSDVARFRGVTVKRASETFGQGDMLIADDAKKAKMIDEITTFEKLLESIKS